MSFLNTLLEWTKNTFLPLGYFGIFTLAFIEASFFPIPPDILLIIFSLAEPSKALLFASIATIGSVLGGIFGYGIGLVGKVALLEKLFKKSKIEKVHNLFNKYEAWAIFIAGFTPIPYKIFTIAGGAFYINFKKFVIASLLSRGLRFFIIATLIMFYGETMVNFFKVHFELLTLLIVLFAILIYYFYKKLT